MVFEKTSYGGVYYNIFGRSCYCVADITLLCNRFGKNINPMITGAIMPLVPGLAITNAIRDIIAGDYLSGGARLFDAVVVAIALATGAGSVMYIFGHMTGGIMG